MRYVLPLRRSSVVVLGGSLEYPAPGRFLGKPPLQHDFSQLRPLAAGTPDLLAAYVAHLDMGTTALYTHFILFDQRETAHFIPLQSGGGNEAAVMPVLKPGVTLRRRTNSRAAPMFRHCLALSFLFLTQGGCRNPVSNEEAQKYLAPRASPDDSALVIYRIVPNRSWRQRAEGWILSDTAVLVDKLLDSGYTDSTFSSQLSHNDWYCEEYSPGLYMLRSIRHRESLSYIIEHTTTPIHARFHVPQVPQGQSVYIGSFHQKSNGRWMIRNESDLAEGILKQMKPKCRRRLSVELARWEDES